MASFESTVGVRVSLLLIVAAAAAAGPAATQSTSEKPLDGLRLYNLAMQAGDTKTMIARQYTTNDMEERIARAAARTDTAIAGLVRTAVKKFGPEALRKVSNALGDVRTENIKETTLETPPQPTSPNPPASPASPPTAILMGSLDDSKDDDGELKPLAHLVLIDGQWKIDIGALIDHDPKAGRPLLDSILRNANLCKVLQQDLDADHITTLEALVQRITSAQAD